MADTFLRGCSGQCRFQRRVRWSRLHASSSIIDARYNGKTNLKSSAFEAVMNISCM